MTVTLNGRKPANPFGTCFDSAAANLLYNCEPQYDEAVMCHGICIANYPGEEGQRIAHAWIELVDPVRGRIAIDPIWLLAVPVEHYRKTLQPELVIEYKKPEFIALWRGKGYPGPWDERILALTTEGKQHATESST